MIKVMYTKRELFTCASQKPKFFLDTNAFHLECIEAKQTGKVGLTRDPSLITMRAKIFCIYHITFRESVFAQIVSTLFAPNK